VKKSIVDGSFVFALLLTAPIYLFLLINGYIGSALPTRDEMRIIVRIRGVVTGAPFLAAAGVALLAMAVRSSLPRVGTRERTLIFISFAVAASYIAILPPSILAGHNTGYIVGDLYRALLPCLVLLCLLSIFSVNSAFANNFVRQFVVAMVATAVIAGAWKARAVISGQFYGPGLNAYSISGFVLALGLLTLVEGNTARKTKIVIAVLLFGGIVFSVLSLKRDVWMGLIATAFLVGLAVRSKVSYSLWFLAFAAAATFAIISSGAASHIEARALYTLGGQSRIIDSSSAERVGEIAGSLHTFRRDGHAVQYLLGMGHGAEFQANPHFPLMHDQTGSRLFWFHHIHNTYALMAFRYGLIGIVSFFALLSLPIAIVARVLFDRRHTPDVCFDAQLVVLEWPPQLAPA